MAKRQAAPELPVNVEDLSREQREELMKQMLSPAEYEAFTKVRQREAEKVYNQKVKALGDVLLGEDGEFFDEFEEALAVVDSIRSRANRTAENLIKAGINKPEDLPDDITSYIPSTEEMEEEEELEGDTAEELEEEPVTA